MYQKHILGVYPYACAYTSWLLKLLRRYQEQGNMMFWLQVNDIEVAYIKSLRDEPAPQITSVMEEMGTRYDPRRLADALKGKDLEVSARGFRITYTLGKFIIGLTKVSHCSPSSQHLCLT